MTMLMPTPFKIRPTSFRHFASFGNFFGLRPTLGTVLRITADASSIWIAFLFGWLVVDGKQLAALPTQESVGIFALIGLASVLACIAYTSAGQYNHTHEYNLWAKIQRIMLVNLALFIILLIASAVVLPAGHPAALRISLLLTTVIGSAVLQSFARFVSVVLRSEDSYGGNGMREH